MGVTEKDLRPHVVKWLIDNGMEVAHECWSLNNCDVVGFEFDKQTSRLIPAMKRVIAVELKIRDFDGVLSQCRNHRRYCNEVFAAMPKCVCDKMELETAYKFVHQGIGLLAVGENGQIEEREHSLEYAPSFYRIKKALWRWHRKNTEVERLRNKDIYGE